MSFYKEIIPFVEYIQSIRKIETYFSFDIIFPTKWSIPKNLVDENKIVGFEVQDTNFKGISFVCSIDEKEVAQTLLRVAKIIKLNKEKEQKEVLFKQTIEKLKKTFMIIVFISRSVRYRCIFILGFKYPPCQL